MSMGVRDDYANLTSIAKVFSKYDALFEMADPRVDGLLLMSSPVPVTLICILYIYFVLKAGPEYMKNRKPYNLRSILIVYNAAQTVFSAWLFFESSKHWIHLSLFSQCSTSRHTDTDEGNMWSVKMCHLYFLSKISELADTIFFVLKKKQRNISTLHVFHHAIMPFSVWFGVKFSPGGNLTFFGLPNLFVHIWMYLYYMLAAMGPQYQKYVWWKRHITEMQLAQFAVVMVYMLYISHFCNLSRYFLYWILIIDVVFVVMFADFYIKAYVGKDKKRAEIACVLPQEKVHQK